MAPHEGRVDTLVLGIGNLLWADEGFGVRCIEYLLEHYELSANVRVLDGGTQGLYLLPDVQQARRLIVFDAIDYGLPPGALRLIENEAVPRFMGAKKMSLHQTGFQEVIAAAALTGRLPEEMLLVGAQPEELEDFGGSLRPTVRARVPLAVWLAVRRLRAWGHRPTRLTLPVSAAGPQSILGIATYESGRPSAVDACRVGDERVLAAAGGVV